MMLRLPVVVAGFVMLASVVVSGLLSGAPSGGTGEVEMLRELSRMEAHGPVGADSVTMFPTQGVEYLIAVVFIVLFGLFWRVLTVRDGEDAAETSPQEGTATRAAPSAPAMLEEKRRSRKPGAKSGRAGGRGA